MVHSVMCECACELLLPTSPVWVCALLSLSQQHPCYMYCYATPAEKMLWLHSFSKPITATFPQPSRWPKHQKQWKPSLLKRMRKHLSSHINCRDACLELGLQTHSFLRTTVCDTMLANSPFTSCYWMLDEAYKLVLLLKALLSESDAMFCVQ